METYGSFQVKQKDYKFLGTIIVFLGKGGVKYGEFRSNQKDLDLIIWFFFMINMPGKSRKEKGIVRLTKILAYRKVIVSSFLTNRITESFLRIINEKIQDKLEG